MILEVSKVQSSVSSTIRLNLVWALFHEMKVWFSISKMSSTYWIPFVIQFMGPSVGKTFINGFKACWPSKVRVNQSHQRVGERIVHALRHNLPCFIDMTQGLRLKGYLVLLSCLLVNQSKLPLPPNFLPLWELNLANMYLRISCRLDSPVPSPSQSICKEGWYWWLLGQLTLIYQIFFFMQHAFQLTLVHVS